MQLEFVFASSDRSGSMSCCREILLGWRDKSPTDFWMGMWHRSEGDDDTGAGDLSSAGPLSMACYLSRQGRGGAGRGGAGGGGAGVGWAAPVRVRGAHQHTLAFSPNYRQILISR